MIIGRIIQLRPIRQIRPQKEKMKTELQQKLAAFQTLELRPAALDLLGTLGYSSDKTIALDGSPAAFLEELIDACVLELYFPDFCELYYARCGGVPDEIAPLLLGVLEKTKSRGIAAGALNGFVESGDMHEFEALDRMVDWRERNDC